MDIRKQRSLFPQRPLALGAAAVWGLIEVVALWRSRWVARHQHGR